MTARPTASYDAEPGAAPPVITLREAAFGYGGQAVVREVDLTVRAGEAIAVVGPNGAGKSTLARGLLGLTEHLGGRAEILGQDLAHLDRTLIGYVPQRHTLSTSVRATVAEVVAIGRLGHLRWWQRPGAADRAVIRQALETVGLGDRSRDDVATLSGGQQRRVLIARALAGEPRVLVMDEPTAGVDSANQEVLAQVLGRLVADGLTLVVVTHELAALRGVISRVVEVAGGLVRFDGTPQEWAHASAATAARALGVGPGPSDDLDARQPPAVHAPGTLGVDAQGPLDGRRPL